MKRMKTWHSMLIVAALTASGAVCVQAQLGEPRIVFADLDRVFTEYYRTQQADKQLKDLAEEFKAERKAMVAEFDELQDDFKTARDDAQNTAYSEDMRSQKRVEAEEKLVEIREQESKIRRFDESRQKQLDDQSRRMRKRIVEDITKELDSYARTQGYTAVIDSSGETLNGVPVVIYRDPKLDVTESIVSLLNRGRDAAAEAAPALSAPAPAPELKP
jgi:Skp family chaperone for outer membrane proteins